MSFKIKILCLFVFLNIVVLPVYAAIEPEISFSVKALFKDRAMIEINGEQRFLSAGQKSPEGVKLISSNAHEAIIQCHGKEYTLYINQSVYSGESTVEDKPRYKVPKKLVPGKAVAFIKTEENSIIKYRLKSEFKNPALMQYAQDAVWIASGNKLLRFDVNKQAWGVFDSSYSITDHITQLAISEKEIVLNASIIKNNKKSHGLFSFDSKARKLRQKLNIQPRSSQFVGNELWFLTYNKGLGVFVPHRNRRSISYSDALLDKNNKQENAYKLSANGDDIWYSNYTRYRSDKEKQRLNEVCVTHYNAKTRSYRRYTRKDMGIESSYNCTYLAVSRRQVWISHGSNQAGLSMFNIESGKWTHISASTNNVMLGGQNIMLENDHLWMITRNQLVGLNTHNLYANVVLGDAVVKNPWQSTFYVKNGVVWFATKEYIDKKFRKSKLVLYEIPLSSTLKQIH